MEKVRICDLRPVDGRKSFYGKAKVVTTETEIQLFSYDTLVCTYNPETWDFNRVWNGYSVTTMRHVNAFRERFCKMHKLSKSEWLSL